MSYYVGKKRFTSILEAQQYLKSKYEEPGKKIRYVPVCAFGKVDSCYLTDANEGYDWKMNHHIADITYGPNYDGDILKLPVR